MKAQGLAFRETVIVLDQPDTQMKIKTYSAAGKVPVLLHGDITIWDSLAILEYLAEVFADRSWWPKDSHARATARAISAEMHSGFRDMRIAMPMNVRKTGLEVARTEGVDNDIARIATIWRECRAKFGSGGPFLFGAFSNADAMYAPVVTRFKTYGVELDAANRAYSDAVLSHPAMREWFSAAADEPVVAKYELK